jgi:hypothetical protein
VAVATTVGVLAAAEQFLGLIVAQRLTPITYVGWSPWLVATGLALGV